MTLNGHTAKVVNGQFSPDGSKVVTCSYDTKVNFIRANLLINFILLCLFFIITKKNIQFLIGQNKNCN